MCVTAMPLMCVFNTKNPTYWLICCTDAFIGIVLFGIFGPDLGLSCLQRLSADDNFRRYLITDLNDIACAVLTCEINALINYCHTNGFRLSAHSEVTTAHRIWNMSRVNGHFHAFVSSADILQNHFFFRKIINVLTSRKPSAPENCLNFFLQSTSFVSSAHYLKLQTVFTKSRLDIMSDLILDTLVLFFFLEFKN